MTVEQALAKLIEAARAEYGETEYTYFKQVHRWSGSRRSGAYYTSVTNRGEPITQEQYEDGLAQGKKDEVDAFMGRRKGMDYYTYEREISKRGWREHLIELLKEQAKSKRE